jgi:hypothetical protein
MSPGSWLRPIGLHTAADLSLSTSRHKSSLSFNFYVARASHARLWAENFKRAIAAAPATIARSDQFSPLCCS